MIDALTADAEVRDGWAALRPGHDPSAGGEGIARLAWSTIVEPGDPVAGALVAHLGSQGALRFLVADDELPAGSGPTRRALSERRVRWRQRLRLDAVRRALTDARRSGARPVLPGDRCWPEALDDLGEQAPLLLWIRGDRDALTVPERAVSLVGARAATAYGEHMAREIAGDLVADGAVAVSGGAYGIDGAVHRAALGAGGRTIAVLAGGVDRDYPAGHHRLFRRIEESGALLAEVPCGAVPSAHRFLARNRLIGALGRATVVIEAGWRSGSLNTAGHAATLGRPLGAVPGPVTSAVSAGCHRLLREYDARCVTSAAEVRELMQEGGGLPATGGGAEHARLWEVLSSRVGRSPVELAGRAGVPVARAEALLGIWELEGRARRTDAGWRRAVR